MEQFSYPEPKEYLDFIYQKGGQEALMNLQQMIEDACKFPQPNLKGKYFKTDQDIYFKVLEIFKDSRNRSIEILFFTNDDSFYGTDSETRVTEDEFLEFNAIEITPEEFFIALNKRIMEL